MYPRAYAERQTGSDAWSMQTECLVTTGGAAKLDLRIRFLQLVNREIGKLDAPLANFPDAGDLHYQPVDSFAIQGQTLQSWQETCEREVTLANLNIEQLAAPTTHDFVFPAGQQIETRT